jgi:NAD(P)-dependent dehydrogenase (short-subunit alcohol dehydrogenase family)
LWSSDGQDDRGQRLANELGARVAREADVQAAVAGTVRRFGRLDCLFNNAGYAGVQGRIDEIPADGFDDTIGVLLRGVWRVALPM